MSASYPLGFWAHLFGRTDCGKVEASRGRLKLDTSLRFDSVSGPRRMRGLGKPERRVLVAEAVRRSVWRLSARVIKNNKVAYSCTVYVLGSSTV